MQARGSLSPEKKGDGNPPVSSTPSNTDSDLFVAYEDSTVTPSIHPQSILHFKGQVITTLVSQQKLKILKCVNLTSNQHREIIIDTTTSPYDLKKTWDAFEFICPDENTLVLVFAHQVEVWDFNWLGDSATRSRTLPFFPNLSNASTYKVPNIQVMDSDWIVGLRHEDIPVSMTARFSSLWFFNFRTGGEIIIHKLDKLYDNLKVLPNSVARVSRIKPSRQEYATHYFIDKNKNISIQYNETPPNVYNYQHSSEHKHFSYFKKDRNFNPILVIQKQESKDSPIEIPVDAPCQTQWVDNKLVYTQSNHKGDHLAFLFNPVKNSIHPLFESSPVKLFSNTTGLLMCVSANNNGHNNKIRIYDLNKIPEKDIVDALDQTTLPKVINTIIKNYYFSYSTYSFYAKKISLPPKLFSPFIRAEITNYLVTKSTKNGRTFLQPLIDILSDKKSLSQEIATKCVDNIINNPEIRGALSEELRQLLERIKESCIMHSDNILEERRLELKR